MFKKTVISLLLITYYLLLTSSVHAASPSPSSTPDGEENSNVRAAQIQELQQKLATQVAQIRKNSRRVLYGQIKSISDPKIIITSNSDEKTLVTNEDTTFYKIGSSGKKEISLDNLTEGQSIVGMGLLSQNDGSLNTKFVLAEDIPFTLVGKVTDVDLSGGTITIETAKREGYIVDIEVFTKINIWDKNKGTTKLGFSKVKIGNLVHINASLQNNSKSKENRVTANRILVLSFSSASPSPISSPSPSPK